MPDKVTPVGRIILTADSKAWCVFFFLSFFFHNNQTQTLLTQACCCALYSRAAHASCHHSLIPGVITNNHCNYVLKPHAGIRCIPARATSPAQTQIHIESLRRVWYASLSCRPAQKQPASFPPVWINVSQALALALEVIRKDLIPHLIREAED